MLYFSAPHMHRAIMLGETEKINSDRKYIVHRLCLVHMGEVENK